MRIGFNALCAENRSGTGRYASQLLPALAEFDTRNTYVALLRRDSPLRERLASMPNVELHPVSADDALRRVLFERTRLGAWIEARRIDLFHGPAFVTPARCSVPCVVTIHDLVFHLFPESVSWSRRFYYRRAISRSIHRAARILCDSANTARDLREHFAVEPERIVEAPLGVERRFFDAPSAAENRRVRDTYALPERFLLTVGTIEPRKNLPVLLRAYARLRARRSDTPGLVVVGRQGWGMRDPRRMARDLGIEPETHFPGFVADADLPALYHLADVFVCVSLYEGFGLPVLEAMAAGTPVVAADNSSFPQVAGEAAWRVDARDSDRIAQALEHVLANPEDARHRAEDARRRAETFTWRATAEKTLDAYEAAVSA